MTANTRRIYSPAESQELYEILERWHEENPNITVPQALQRLQREYPHLGERATPGAITYRLGQIRKEAPELSEAFARWQRARQNLVQAQQEVEASKHDLVEIMRETFPDEIFQEVVA